MLAVVAAVLAGALAFGLAARAGGDLGPLRVAVRLAPSAAGRTILEFPPFGRVVADTHIGMLTVTATLEEIDVRAVQGLAADGSFTKAGVDGWISGLRHIVVRAAVVGLLAAVASAVAVAFALTRSWRTALVAALLVTVLPGGALAAGALTYDQNAFREPTFEGALTYAPAAFDLVQQKVSDIRDLQQEAKALAASLSAYYGTSQSIATGGSLSGTYRILHVSDQHLDPVGQQLAADLANAYDVSFVIDTGDAAYFGTEEEAKLAAAQIGDRPYIFVPGNHDSDEVLSALSARGNVTVLDDETTTTPTGITVLGVGDPAGRSLDYLPDKAASEKKGRAAAAESRETTPNIVAVHNPVAGRPFKGKVPLVLSGHTHKPSLDVSGGTVFLGAGTTGGVDFGDLKSDPQIPHTADILYFSKKEPGRLVAIDQIEVYGKTRQSSIRRTVIDEAFVAGR